MKTIGWKSCLLLDQHENTITSLISLYMLSFGNRISEICGWSGRLSFINDLLHTQKYVKVMYINVKIALHNFYVKILHNICVNFTQFVSQFTK